MTAPVHPKVRASTIASLCVSIVLAVLVWLQDHPRLIGNLPAPLQGILVLVIPPLLTFVAGYRTPGPNLPPAPDTLA